MSDMCFHRAEWWSVEVLHSALPFRGMTAKTCQTCGARLEVDA